MEAFVKFMGRIIKRYENRKLYDTESRKYISLEEIASLVRQGVDVQVVDNVTDTDITTQTLTQVIFEEGKRGRNPLSTEVLHDVIRWSNHLLDDGIQQVRQGLDHLVPESLNKLFGKNTPDEVEELKKRVQSLEELITSLGNQLSSDQEEDLNGSK
jgi:polyhydroxyalkanoate synthesis repressor PhaR